MCALIVLGLLVGGYVGQRALKRSPYFRLEKIQVEIEGGRFLTREGIIKRSGLILGQNLFTINLEALKRRLELEPWVAEAFVSRKFPHTIYLKVREENPLAMVATKKGIFLVDEEGVLFAKAPRELLKELPAIGGLSPRELRERRLFPERRPVLLLLKALKEREKLVPPYANISQIKFDDEGFWLITRDALRVKFLERDLKDLLWAYRKLDRILVYLYETNQYQRVRVVRLDYPKDKAALVFKKTRGKG